MDVVQQAVFTVAATSVLLLSTIGGADACNPPSIFLSMPPSVALAVEPTRYTTDGKYDRSSEAKNSFTDEKVPQAQGAWTRDRKEAVA